MASSAATNASNPTGATAAGQPDVIAFNEPRSPAAEAFRTLRTNLRFAGVDRPLRRVLLTSASPDEGKSTVVANLAVTLAEAEMRVILVDGDLRRPSQHEIFHLPNDQGLTSLFLGSPSSGGSHMEPPLRETAVAGLWVLTSGPLPPNPAELLGSARMDAVLDELTRRADMVLIDTPPVVAVTDAAVLSAKVDGCLLVVGAGVVKRDVARRARTALEAVHANVLGVVVNNVPLDPDTFGHYGEVQPAAAPA